MSKLEDIMEATLDLIVEEGLDSVTFAKIFKRASVGAGTVYNYFENKEQLINELYKKSRLNMSSRLLIDYDPDSGLYARFKCLVQNYLKYARDFSREFIFVDSYSFSSSIPPEVRNLNEDGGIRELLSVIHEGQRLGILQDMEPYMSIQIVHGIISSIVRGFHIQKYPLNELQLQQTVDACWKAIKF
ncbi:TetR/AcrR family transcriptional regulator [Paenibacillus sepulcri]|uniref:TetR/AcrR family transcriptional regulator n=1 Tax=Paenibacillus sepulcri TaxID=359917 RepID=A0ABS7CBZ7_9BACL|nr:TetR/AcrR family transcriptional regulator [Paenibacillus sepulcri]